MIIIRAAQEKDIAPILEIYNYAIRHTTSVYSDTAHTMEMRTKWFEEKKAANHPVLVAEVDDKIAGFISYGPFRSWPGYRYTVEHSVHVHKDFRRQGIASRLLEKMIEIARKNGVHAIIGGVDAANDASIKLHEQFGFEEVGCLKQVGYKFDHWLDLVFVELVLDIPDNSRDKE
jgi:L-amino acid N-acyltransferase